MELIPHAVPVTGQSNSTSINWHGQDWHNRTVNNGKNFMLGGSYVQLKSVKTCCLFAVLGCLHRNGMVQPKVI